MILCKCPGLIVFFFNAFFLPNSFGHKSEFSRVLFTITTKKMGTPLIRPQSVSFHGMVSIPFFLQHITDDITHHPSETTKHILPVTSYLSLDELEQAIYFKLTLPFFSLLSGLSTTQANITRLFQEP